MKTIQVNEKLLAAAKEYIVFVETPREPDMTEGSNLGMRKMSLLHLLW